MIYILSNEPAECVKLLDDRSLGKMISACAQVLCNAHYKIEMEKQEYALKMLPITIPEFSDRYNFISDKIKQDLPIEIDMSNNKEWTNWARACLANYQLLLSYAQACCEEWEYRFSDLAELKKTPRTRTVAQHKHHDVIEWCSENVPELPKLCTHNGGYLKYKPYDPEHPCTCDDHTPTPLVMPDKYIQYLSSTVRENTPKPFDVYQSYINYYCAKLKKMTRKKCKQCDGTTRGMTCTKCLPPCDIGECTECYNGTTATGYITQAPTWSRRSKPEWLGDL